MQREVQKAATSRHIQSQKHPQRMPYFQHNFSVHQKQTRPPCFQGAQKTPRVGTDTTMSSRAPPAAPGLLSATARGWHGWCARVMQHCRGTTTATRQMEETPSTLLPHLPPLLPPPPAQKGEVRVTLQLQGYKPLASHLPPPHVGTSYFKKWGPSRATLPEHRSRPKHTYLNSHGCQ